MEAMGLFDYKMLNFNQITHDLPNKLNKYVFHDIMISFCINDIL